MENIRITLSGQKPSKDGTLGMTDFVIYSRSTTLQKALYHFLLELESQKKDGFTSQVMPVFHLESDTPIHQGSVIKILSDIFKSENP